MSVHQYKWLCHDFMGDNEVWQLCDTKYFRLVFTYYPKSKLVWMWTPSNKIGIIWISEVEINDWDDELRKIYDIAKYPTYVSA